MKKKTIQQYKLTFNGIHKWYENCDSYMFRNKEVLMDKPIHLGFAVKRSSKMLTYETYYDKVQPYFGQKNLQLHNMDADSFVLGIKIKNITKDLETLEDMFHFSILYEKHELFSTKNKNVIGK